MDRDDLPFVVALNNIDAFEGDGFAVAAFAFAGPFGGCRVAVDEDAVFGEAYGLESAVDLSQKLAQSFVAMQWRRADRVVADGIGIEGVDPPLYVHGANCGEVFGDGLLAGGWHSASVRRRGLSV